MIKVGEHITLDIIGTDREYDPSIYEKVIKEIAEAAKVTILNISKYKFCQTAHSNILFCNIIYRWLFYFIYCMYHYMYHLYDLMSIWI